jgi:flagellar motor switch protein FliN/FliY
MEPTLGGRQQELIAALAAELAGVVSALLGSHATAVPGAAPLSPAWRVGCLISGPLSGTITLAIGDADATALARRLMGMDDDPPADAVVDTLGEVVGQAVGGLGQQPVAGGARIRVEGSATKGALLPLEPPAVFDIAMEDGTSLRFGCWLALEAAEAAAQGVPAPSSPAAVMGATPGGTATRPTAPAPPAPPLDNLDVILDIELPLTVRFGRTEMTLQALTSVGPGSVIDLDRSPDEPVEVLINEKVIARGEVVVVAGNYGVRVTEVTSAADRIRSMG